MADKQNGYTAFPNTLVDAFMPILTGAEWKVLDVIVRKTLGWHKVWDEISASQFHTRTGVSKKAIWAIVTDMEKRKLIQVRRAKEDGRRAKNEYALMYSDMQKAEELVTSSDISPQVTYHLRLAGLVTLCDAYYAGLVTSGNTQKKVLDLKKRKKAKETENLVVPTPEEKMELWKANILKVHGVPHWDQKLQDRTYRLEAKIREAFGGDCCHANIEDHQLVLMQLMGYKEGDVLTVAGNRDTPGRTSQGIEWILNAMEGK